MVAPLIFTWSFAFMKNSSCPLLVSSCQAGRLCSRPFQVSSATAKTCSRAAWGTGAGAGRNMRHSAVSGRCDALFGRGRAMGVFMGWFWWFVGISVKQWDYYTLLLRITSYYYILLHLLLWRLWFIGDIPSNCYFHGQSEDTNPVFCLFFYNIGYPGIPVRQIHDLGRFCSSGWMLRWMTPSFLEPGMTLQSWRWMSEPWKP